MQQRLVGPCKVDKYLCYRPRSLQPALFRTADFHISSPPPAKGSSSTKRLPREASKHILVLYPTGDSITRGNGESTGKATAETQRRGFWWGSRIRAQSLFSSRGIVHLPFRAVPTWGCRVGEIQRVLVLRVSCRDQGSKPAAKRWWEEKYDGRTEEAKKRSSALISF